MVFKQYSCGNQSISIIYYRLIRFFSTKVQKLSTKISLTSSYNCWRRVPRLRLHAAYLYCFNCFIASAGVFCSVHFFSPFSTMALIRFKVFFSPLELHICGREKKMKKVKSWKINIVINNSHRIFTFSFLGVAIFIIWVQFCNRPTFV